MQGKPTAAWTTKDCTNLQQFKGPITLRLVCGLTTQATYILRTWCDRPWAVAYFKHWNFAICFKNIEVFMKQFLKKEIVKEESLILRVLQFKLCSVLLAYLRQFKSKSPIQGHFWKLEIKGFHLAPRFLGFYLLLMKILAPKSTQTTAEVCLHSLYCRLRWCLQSLNTNFLWAAPQSGTCHVQIKTVLW